MSITRDRLKKSYTHVKELQGLQGVAVRKLGTKEAVEKAFQDLFDEYADRKYSIISELKTENNRLKTQLKACERKEKELNEDIKDLCKLNDSLLNKIKRLAPKWWEFWRW